MAEDDFDIYGERENANDIREKNTFPADQPPEKQPPSNPEGQVTPHTVDYKQPAADERWGFNRPSGKLSIYDPFNPDRQLMDTVEQELIEISSPPMLYYRLDKEVQNVDKMYGESKVRYYSDPIQVVGSYQDPAPLQELTKYGFTAPEEIDVYFNYNYLLKEAGDRLHIGSILRTYDGKLWEIVHSSVQDEPLWRAIHNNVKAIRANTEGIILPDYGNVSVSPFAERNPPIGEQEEE